MSEGKDFDLSNIEYGDIFHIADMYGIPASVTIEVGTLCNLRCKHCYISNHNDSILELDRIDDIFKQLRDLGTFEVVLTGGELFVRNDAIDIIELARKYGFDVIIFSNATLLNEDIVKKLSNLYIGMFSTSIYSMDKRVNDCITGVDGSLESTFSGLSLLKKYGIPVEVKCMAMKENYLGIIEIYNYCKDNGFGCVVSPYLFCRDDRNREPIKLRLNYAELEYAMPIIDKIIGFHPQKHDLEDFVCPSLQHSFGINAAGKVSPCNAMFYEVGDIYTNSLKEIWNSEKLRKVKNIKYKNLITCKDCKNSEFCVRCAGIALGETGNMLDKFDFACEIASIRSRC